MEYDMESYCDKCGNKLGKKRKLITRLVFVNDGYGKYYAFDCERCAYDYVKKFGTSLDGMGSHSYEECQKLADKLTKTQGWSISWTSIKILEERIKRGDDKDIYEEFD